MAGEIVSTTPILQLSVGWNMPAVVVNPYSTLGIPAFWTALRFISETTASLPLTVKRRQGKKVRPMPDHPLVALLNSEAAPGVKSYSIRQAWAMHAAHRGNGYLLITRQNGKPIRLSHLDCDGVTPFTDMGERFYQVRTRKGPVILDHTEVAHIHLLSYDGLSGIDPTIILAPTFELAASIDNYTRNFLANGGHFSGYIKFGAGTTPEDLATSRANFNGFTGIGQAGSIPGLLNAEYIAVGAKNSEAELTAIRDRVVADIASIERIPPSLLYQLAKSPNGNTEQQTAEAVIFGLRVWIEQQEQELTLKLLTAQERADGLYIEADFTPLLRADPLARAAQVQGLVTAGLITKNEGRAMLGLEPIDDPLADELQVNVSNAQPSSAWKDPEAKDPPAKPESSAAA